jgi:hypothetical protein
VLAVAAEGVVVKWWSRKGIKRNLVEALPFHWSSNPQLDVGKAERQV